MGLPKSGQLCRDIYSVAKISRVHYYLGIVAVDQDLTSRKEFDSVHLMVPDISVPPALLATGV